jgi:hypothetical protein
MAQAARAEEARVAQELVERASAATPGQETERPRQDLVNTFETPGGVDETLTPECRVKPRVSVVLPPNIEGGELDVETQEDFDRLDNDILAQPAVPDFNTVLFSPETIEAFASPARHARALGMVKELLQQKDEIAKLAYARRVANNPHDIEKGAQLFGNVTGLARYKPPGLREASIDLIPGSKPVRQGMRRFTSEETAEIRRQVVMMPPNHNDRRSVAYAGGETTVSTLDAHEPNLTYGLRPTGDGNRRVSTVDSTVNNQSQQQQKAGVSSTRITHATRIMRRLSGRTTCVSTTARVTGSWCDSRWQSTRLAHIYLSIAQGLPTAAQTDLAGSPGPTSR